MSELVKNISDADFSDEVLSSNIPVLVDFWAEWCGPCKAVAPLLDQAAEDYKDKLKIVKVDVDHNMEVPARHGIRGIPTMIIFKNGVVAGQKVGALSKSQLMSFIDSHI